ncbi:hypothetical protein I0E98_21430 [Pseudomonas lalucatii]|nr:hypothetical protein [Pseudomonas lalucatii]
MTLSTTSGLPVTGHSGLTFTLANGETVSIAAGATSGSSAPVTVADDALVGGQPAVVNSIASVTGGNVFENLVNAGNTSVTVTDEPGTPGNPGSPNEGDPITLSIAGKENSYSEAQQPVFVISISQAQASDVLVTLSNGDTVTILANQTSAEYSAAAQGDDVLVDAGTLTLGVANATVNGAAFENLTLGSAASVAISDTSDTVTATLTSNVDTVAEGGQIVYTVTLSTTSGLPVTGHSGLTFTLANGETVSIAAGATSGSSAPVTVADDALVGGQPAVVNSIASVTGGNVFENLVNAGNTSVTVTDEPGTPGNPGTPAARMKVIRSPSASPARKTATAKPSSRSS